MKNTSYSEKDIVPIMEEVIKSGGSCKLRVTGYSMNPTLRHLKDSVVLVSPQKRAPKKDEIVFIKRDTGKHVLHRIRKIINESQLDGGASLTQNNDISIKVFAYNSDKLINLSNKISDLIIKEI